MIVLALLQRWAGQRQRASNSVDVAIDALRARCCDARDYLASSGSCAGR